MWHRPCARRPASSPARWPRRPSRAPDRRRAPDAESLEGRRLLSSIVEYPLPTADSVPVAIAQGPGGQVWFAEQGSNLIGSIDPAMQPRTRSRRLRGLGIDRRRDGAHHTIIDPPVITAQPASRTNNTGTSATFTVAVTGSLPFSRRIRTGYDACARQDSTPAGNLVIDRERFGHGPVDVDRQ